MRRWMVVMVASVVALSIGVVRADTRAERNKALVRRVMEEIPVDDWDAQAALHSEDFVWHGPDGVTTMTRDEFGEGVLKLYAAFPDFKRTIKDMVAEGDKVAVRMVFRGTHRGTWEGIPATGKKITDHDMVLLRIADGKIVEAWEQYDQLSFMEQLTSPRKGAKATEPAAVKQMLKRLAGHWSWTGEQEDIDSEASPYGQAGRFAGHGDGRLIMDGQFILDKWQEKSPEGNMLYGISLVGYDPIKKCFVAHDCMSDGSTSISEFTFDGRTRKDRITITSKTGETLLARVAGEYSDDWKRFESTWEGSADNGKTWQKWATLVSEHADDVRSDAEVAIEGTWDLTETNISEEPFDFEKYGALKAFGNGTFICVYLDKETGTTLSTSGGPYTFDGKTLKETIAFINGGDDANDAVAEMLGKTFTYRITINEGKLHLAGTFMDYTLNEVWTRVKPD